jgi:hypothetical protein
MILALKSGEELAHKLPCKVICNAVPGKAAGSHQIGPQSFVVLANHFRGQVSTECRLADAVRTGTKKSVTCYPDPCPPFNQRVCLPRVRDNLNILTPSEPVDHLLAYLGCAFVGPEGINIQSLYSGETVCSVGITVWRGRKH